MHPGRTIVDDDLPPGVLTYGGASRAAARNATVWSVPVRAPRTAGSCSEPYTCESNFIRVMFTVLTSSFLTSTLLKMQAIEGGWAYLELATSPARVDYGMDGQGAHGCLE